LSLNQPEHCRV